MPKRIEKLTVKDFRGATVPLEIEFDKQNYYGQGGGGDIVVASAVAYLNAVNKI